MTAVKDCVFVYRDRDVTCVARRCTSRVLVDCLSTSRRRAVLGPAAALRGPSYDRLIPTVNTTLSFSPLFLKQESDDR